MTYSTHKKNKSAIIDTGRKDVDDHVRTCSHEWGTDSNALHITVPQRTGFTISEVLISMAIIAILFLLTYPRFSNTADNTHRLMAQSQMEVLALALARDFTLTDAYSDLITEGEFKISPTLEQYYQLKIQPEEHGNHYTIIASPIGIQTRDECGVLTLNSKGLRTAAYSDCWK